MRGWWVTKQAADEDEQWPPEQGEQHAEMWVGIRALTSWGKIRCSVQQERQVVRGKAGWDEKEQTQKVLSAFLKLGFLQL